MPIQVLPVYLVNKIAAGEVIERPASVAKELIENALDAGTTRIDVAVEDGGKKLISVTDDGAGMTGEDLALAFAPHATSKIAAEDDLVHIRTMGFRGEALASMAAVAHAHIRTRRPEDGSGCEIEASGDAVGEVRPCAAAGGTTVTIRDLFFNTPGRRKFMRTTNTELGHVSECLSRLALPHPQVAFTLTHNGREILNLPAADSTRRRVTDLFGAELGDGLLPIVPRGGRVGIAGLIATPSAARGSSKWQYFFLNTRYIRDRLLAHALREAYRGLIDPARWPMAFVFIRIDPGEVDINVHPTKIEVRFRDSQLVHGELLAGLRETLNSADLTPVASLSVPADARAAGGDQAAEQRRTSLRQALADFFKSAPSPQPRLGFERHGGPSAAPGAAERPHREVSPTALPAAAPAATAAPVAPTPGVQAPPAPEAIQIHNSYIVAADADGLVIIDQHALHERLIYNDLKRRLADPGAAALAGQRLLIPETIDVTAGEAAALAARRDLLASLGIELDAFGPNTVAVQQFPSLLLERGVACGAFLREVIDRLVEDETTDPERLLEDMLEMMACKAAVKAGDPLTEQELGELLARREEAEKASACPHGRPTTLKLTLKELAKQFKRT